MLLFQLQSTQYAEIVVWHTCREVSQHTAWQTTCWGRHSQVGVDDCICEGTQGVHYQGPNRDVCRHRAQLRADFCKAMDLRLRLTVVADATDGLCHRQTAALIEPYWEQICRPSRQRGPTVLRHRPQLSPAAIAGAIGEVKASRICNVKIACADVTTEQLSSRE